jgi:hypothetical protein
MRQWNGKPPRSRCARTTKLRVLSSESAGFVVVVPISTVAREAILISMCEIAGIRGTGRLWRAISVNRVSYKDASAKQA